MKKSKNILTEVIAVLGDVKNKDRLSEILQRHSVDTIYHAAAYKHVPLVENINNKDSKIEFSTLKVPVEIIHKETT